MSLYINWLEEMQSVYLYNVLVEVETDEAHKNLFKKLAQAAEAQAKVWQEKMERNDEPVPNEYHADLRVKVVAKLIRFFGPRRIKPILAAMKVRGISIYSSRKVIGHNMPTSVDEIGHRHKGMEAGGNLRAAVFGINDGLVSNASLIMGIAGATKDVNTILLTGIAGLLAGACSMAAGEYVSMRSQKELFEYQIGLEKEELEEYPEEEAEELALIYEARGIPLQQARDIAKEMMQDPDHALDTLAREELGLNPDDLGSPFAAALASFLAFSFGAFIPLTAFLFYGGAQSVMWSALVTVATLFIVGVALSLFTGQRAFYCGMRMVVIGVSAGLITYIIGTLLGVGLAI